MVLLSPEASALCLIVATPGFFCPEGVFCLLLSSQEHYLALERDYDVELLLKAEAEEAASIAREGQPPSPAAGLGSEPGMLWQKQQQKQQQHVAGASRVGQQAAAGGGNRGGSPSRRRGQQQAALSPGMERIVSACMFLPAPPGAAMHAEKPAVTTRP